MRHRADLIAQAGQQVQLMQKVLTEMNLHIHHVFSDVDGVSAQAIITAILAGERDPHKLAALRDKCCRSRLEDILEALRGDYRPASRYCVTEARLAITYSGVSAVPSRRTCSWREVFGMADTPPLDEAAEHAGAPLTGQSKGSSTAQTGRAGVSRRRRVVGESR